MPGSSSSSHLGLSRGSGETRQTAARSGFDHTQLHPQPGMETPPPRTNSLPLSRQEFATIRSKLNNSKTSLSNLEKLFGQLTSVDLVFQIPPTLDSGPDSIPDLELAQKNRNNTVPLLFEVEMGFVERSLEEAQSDDQRLEDARKALALIAQDVKKDWMNLKLERWQSRLRAMIQRHNAAAETVECGETLCSNRQLAIGTYAPLWNRQSLHIFIPVPQSYLSLRLSHSHHRQRSLQRKPHALPIDPCGNSHHSPGSSRPGR